MFQLLGLVLTAHRGMPEIREIREMQEQMVLQVMREHRAVPALVELVEKAEATVDPVELVLVPEHRVVRVIQIQ